jgi:hypothetical protein
MARSGKQGHGVTLPDKLVHFADLINGRHTGRTSADQITYSERGNLQGVQFFQDCWKILRARQDKRSQLRNSYRLVRPEHNELML